MTLNVVVLAALLVGGLFSSMETARHRAHARQVARKELQANLEAVARILRPADLRSLDGFDDAGVSKRPLFSRGALSDNIEAVDGEREELRWIEAREQVPGVSAPGRIVHIREGVERTVAENVLGGSFSVHWDDGMLVVQLSTYNTYEDETQVVRGSTSVLVRN